MEEFWKIAVGACGIGAIGAFVFWSLYNSWIKIGIFAKLTKKHTFLLMLAFLVLTFMFGAMSLFTYVHIQPPIKTQSNSQVDDGTLTQLANELKRHSDVFDKLHASLSGKSVNPEESRQISELYSRKRQLNDEWRSLYDQYSNPPSALNNNISFVRQTIRIKMGEIVNEIDSINDRLAKFESKSRTEYVDQRPPLPPTGLRIQDSTK